MKIYRLKVKGVYVPKWYAGFAVNGQRFRLPLFPNERASRQFADKLDVMIGQHETGLGYESDIQRWVNQLSPAMVKRLAKMGLISSQRAAGAKDLSVHITEFKSSLEAAGCSKAHLAGLIPRIEKIVKGCQFRTIQDIDAGKVERFLSGLRDKGDRVVLNQIDPETKKAKEVVKHISPVTYNYHIRAIRQFCKWLVDRGRIHESPVRSLQKVRTTEDDQRRVARVLTVEEVRRLLQTTMAAPDWRGVSGKERALIYLIANESGLRANELRCLRVSDFDFDGCFIRVRDSVSKNKKADFLPMKHTTAAMIHEHIASKDPSDIAFDVKPETFRMIKADLKRAGIPYETEDGTAHFHSLRHGFATRLDSVVLRGTKTAVDLMRHGDARLTLNRYTHGIDERERAAIDALPDLFAPVQKQDRKKA